MNRLNLPGETLTPRLVETLRSLNPHWEGRPGPAVPGFRRWMFETLHRRLLTGISPDIVLRGPRRVGKTVLVRQLIESLLAAEVVPKRILSVAFDEIQAMSGLQDPVLAMARWFEQQVLGEGFNEALRAGRIPICCSTKSRICAPGLRRSNTWLIITTCDFS
jgi:hypothetical protein